MNYYHCYSYFYFHCQHLLTVLLQITYKSFQCLWYKGSLYIAYILKTLHRVIQQLVYSSNSIFKEQSKHSIYFPILFVLNHTLYIELILFKFNKIYLYEYNGTTIINWKIFNLPGLIYPISYYNNSALMIELGQGYPQKT